MWQSDGILLILVNIRRFVAVGNRTRGLRTTTLWFYAFERILHISRGWGQETAECLHASQPCQWAARILIPAPRDSGFKMLRSVGLVARVDCFQGNALSYVSLVAWCRRNMMPIWRPAWGRGVNTDGRKSPVDMEKIWSLRILDWIRWGNGASLVKPYARVEVGCRAALNFAWVNASAHCSVGRDHLRPVIHCHTSNVSSAIRTVGSVTLLAHTRSHDVRSCV
jgi:hypothetical protein